MLLQRLIAGQKPVNLIPREEPMAPNNERPPPRPRPDESDIVGRMHTLASELKHEAASGRLFQDIIQTFISDDQDLQSALVYCLRRVCETLHFRVGHAAIIQDDSMDLDPVQNLWHLTDPVIERKYCRAVEQATNKSTERLKGLLAGLESPVVVSDIEIDQLLGQGDAAELSGIRACALAPIMIDDQPQAMVAFYADEAVEDSRAVLEIVGNIASLIGQQIQLKRLQRAVADSVWLLQRRVGRELHDSVCQDLVGLAFLSKEMLTAVNRNDVIGKDRVKELADGISSALSRARAISKGLSPVECLADELPRALGDLVDSSGKRFGIDFTLDCLDELTLANDAHARHLFFIAHEAMTNAVKHSGATRIELTLKKKSGRVVLIVADNGSGMFHEQDTSSGIGMRIMRHRAETIGANLSIESGARGTTLTCTLPTEVLAS